MSFEIIVLSSVSSQMGVVSAKRISSLYPKVTIHLFSETIDPVATFERVVEISKNCEAVLVVDELVEADSKMFDICERVKGNHRFSVGVVDGLSLQLASIVQSSDLTKMSEDEFYGLLWGKQEMLDKFSVSTTEEDCGSASGIRDEIISYFWGSKLKYFVSKYGDYEDIAHVQRALKNDYFSASPSRYHVGKSKSDPGLVAANLGKVNIPEILLPGKEKYMPQGKGLLFIPLRDMQDCFSIRMFVNSIESQTYNNFEIVAFGMEEDIKDFSNYMLSNVRFEIYKGSEFSYINQKVRETSYDWYGVLNNYCIYDFDYVERMLSTGKNISTCLSTISSVENLSGIFNPTISKYSLLFKKQALHDMGFFDPINYFAVAEMLNRCSSVKYGGLVIVPERMIAYTDLELNHHIDPRINLFETYQKRLADGYSIPRGSFLSEPIKKDIPLEIRTKDFKISKGNLTLSNIFIRTLKNKDRLNNIVSQFKEREINNYVLWENTHKDSKEIKKLYKKGLVNAKECYKCGKIKCDHNSLLTKGQIANFYSMMKLFRSISRNEDSMQSLYLILEDDIRLKNNFVEVINHMVVTEEVVSNISEPLLLRVGWGDMLEYKRDHYYEEKERYEWRESFSRFANPCFMINKHAVIKMLKDFERYDRPCDQWLQIDKGMEIKNFSLYPPICDELSHIGLISSDMHPKASGYEYQHLLYIKTGNIKHLDEAKALRKEYEKFWNARKKQNG